MPDLIVDLKGKGVIVTAAGGSIGSGCALALARCGASLGLNDVNEGALRRTVEQVQALGVPVLPLVGDVSDYQRVQDMAAEAIETFGNVFGLVNIAGASMPKPILEMTQAEWASTWNVNVTSLFSWAHAVLPHMLASEQGGRIVNNSSVSGKQGGDENSVSRGAYAAAKAGVLGLTRGLAREVAPKVTVNAICPGLILNPRTTQLYQARPGMMDRYPMQRPGEGADIGKAVVYFMAADWVTGEVTDVNGGYFID
ncbi:SDR family NAD(P)-dependent oxidoreductase [Candidatus Entotheonella palauensis]|uniref:SDR family NAD(P)-dependent oxidoreductase n=1 Tax=Candidatus Entotheonella palauensis TaxID=93172 RepID=UPI000B7F3F86|nr:SDR family NAD(P)-dependent oxidoreductase [Candidatus Entotheonella palauensis]